MIGDGYWATGITVRYGYSGGGYYGWGAAVEFYDDGWVDDENPDTGAVTTQGTLSTRYLVTEGTMPDADGLSAAVDAVKRDAERLGIAWSRAGSSVMPTVYYIGGGKDKHYPPPDGWRAMVNAQAERLGWQPAYAAEEQGQ